MPPPTGTVTLLFTDIEGSTKLLEEAKDQYAELLAEHRRLLRAAWEGTGYEWQRAFATGRAMSLHEAIAEARTLQIEKRAGNPA